MVQEQLSVVIPIWNRYADLLDRTLYTLANQSMPPHEIIVSDTSSDENYSKNIIDVISKYAQVWYFHNPLKEFSLSRSFNIGIKQTHLESKYILCTGAEMLFSENYLEELLKVMDDGKFAWGACGFLKEDTKYPDYLFEDWPKLLAQIVPNTMAKVSPGTLQCAVRSWWFRVHGYDESLPFAYVDSDIVQRSTLSALERVTVSAEIAQVLHQWHEKSELVRKLGGTLRYVMDNKEIVRNPNGWGEV